MASHAHITMMPAKFRPGMNRSAKNTRVLLHVHTDAIKCLGAAKVRPISLCYCIAGSAPMQPVIEDTKMNTIKRFVRELSDNPTIEYCLIAAVVLVAIIAGVHS